MSSAKDLTGTQIGKLSLLERKREKKRTYYFCKCECGSEVWIRADSLKTTRSCGCLSKKTQFIAKDLTGKIFGRLEVVNKTDKRSKFNETVIWNCKCTCGKYKEVNSNNLLRGGVNSCGCLAKEISSKSIKKAIEVHLSTHIIEGTNIQVIGSGKLMSNNTSGYTGVKWEKRRKKWYADIKFKGKKYYLGRYDKKEDAIEARKEAEERYHKSFLDWYKKEYKK